MNSSVRQDTAFHEDGTVIELLLHLNFAIYQQLNKSYWPQLQQWGLVHNHRTICKQLLQILERRFYCLMQRSKEKSIYGEQKYLSRHPLYWWRSAVLQLGNVFAETQTMSCRAGAAAQTDTTYSRKGDRAGNGNTSFRILLECSNPVPQALQEWGCGSDPVLTDPRVPVETELDLGTGSTREQIYPGLITSPWLRTWWTSGVGCEGRFHHTVLTQEHIHI